MVLNGICFHDVLQAISINEKDIKALYSNQMIITFYLYISLG